MEDSLLPGDKVLVSKLNYGPRMPRSPFEIPWVNLFYYLNREAHAGTDSTWYNYNRLSGFSKIKRGDVIVSNFPYRKKEVFFIKRCIGGLPGESIALKDGRVYSNDYAISPTGQAKMKYQVWVNDEDKFFELTYSLGVYYNTYSYDCRKPYREVVLNGHQLQLLKNRIGIDSITDPSFPPDTVPHTYPWHKNFLWRYDNFGPIVIPRKGMEVQLTPDNYILYKKVFERYEGQKFDFENGKVFNSGKPAEYYKFKIWAGCKNNLFNNLFRNLKNSIFNRF